MIASLRRRILRAIPALLAIGALSCLIWGFFLQPNRLEVHHMHLAVALPPMRVVAISDLHVGSPFIDEAKVREVVRRANDTHPDVILLLGDFVVGHGNDRGQVIGGEFIPAEMISSVLAGLRAPGGVYAVLGNHDWWTDG